MTDELDQLRAMRRRAESYAAFTLPWDHPDYGRAQIEAAVAREILDGDTGLSMEEK